MSIFDGRFDDHHSDEETRKLLGLPAAAIMTAPKPLDIPTAQPRPPEPNTSKMRNRPRPPWLRKVRNPNEAALLEKYDIIAEEMMQATLMKLDRDIESFLAFLRPYERSISEIAIKQSEQHLSSLESVQPSANPPTQIIAQNPLNRATESGTKPGTIDPQFSAGVKKSDQIKVNEGHTGSSILAQNSSATESLILPNANQSNDGFSNHHSDLLHEKAYSLLDECLNFPPVSKSTRYIAVSNWLPSEDIHFSFKIKFFGKYKNDIQLDNPGKPNRIIEVDTVDDASSTTKSTVSMQKSHGLRYFMTKSISTTKKPNISAESTKIVDSKAYPAKLTKSPRIQGEGHLNPAGPQSANSANQNYNPFGSGHHYSPGVMGILPFLRPQFSPPTPCRPFTADLTGVLSISMRRGSFDRIRPQTTPAMELKADDESDANENTKWSSSASKKASTLPAIPPLNFTTLNMSDLCKAYPPPKSAPAALGGPLIEQSPIPPTSRPPPKMPGRLRANKRNPSPKNTVLAARK